MQKLLLFLLLAILSCQQNGSYQPKSISRDAQTNRLDFMDAEFDLPKQYAPIVLNVLTKKLLHGTIDSATHREVSKLLDAGVVKKSGITYFDTLLYANYIVFESGKYMEISKEVASYYIGILEDELNNKWERKGTRYERMESKYFSGSNAQVVKIKYKVHYKHGLRYVTQYLMSANQRTMSVVVTRMDEDDFEDLVMKVRFIE